MIQVCQAGFRQNTFATRHAVVCGLVMSFVAALIAPTVGQDLPRLEQQALRSAAERVAPSVVRIETVGGVERIGKLLVGTGPTTGLVVSADGYIVSSAFNFAQGPSSILVTVPGGSRLPAKLIATDQQRMLVLLKVHASEPLPVPEAVPEDQIQVGQWAVAVGRTFDAAEPNISVGVVSGRNRIWGKAIQTDAKISPSNYGGPLVDIQGRVLGVLVPLSPDSTENIAGVEWYDSGIGFAIPLAHVNSVLPRLQSGADLKPGILGISLKGGDLYSQPPVIVGCRPTSPAYKAGLKSGDRIVEIDGLPIERHAQLRQQINRRYAGDTVHVVVTRGEERLERDIPLVDKLEPYQRPYLGLLAERDAPGTTEGTTVRFVYPESAADHAGLRPGDRIVALDGEAIANRNALLELANSFEVNQPVKLEIRRGEETLNLAVAPALGEVNAAVELPPPRDVPAAPDAGAATGQFAVKIPEFQNECPAYVPASYNARRPSGLVVWLHAAGGDKFEDVLSQWKPACDAQNLILLAPRAADPAKWTPTEVDFVAKTIEQIRSQYTVDPFRVVVMGQQAGGSMAYVTAFLQRDVIRGVVAIDAPMLGKVPENDPAHRLSLLVTQAAKSTFAEPIAAGIQQFRQLKYPLQVIDQGDDARTLNPDDMGTLLRWIDSLDRV